MHALDLVDNLVEYLNAQLSDYVLQTKDGVEKSPTVYDGYLPAKRNARRGEDDPEQEDYPFVIVRYVADEDDLTGNNVVAIKILVGVYNEDSQRGWRDALSVMIRIKTILKESHAIGAAILTGKVNTGLFEVQSKPMYHGIMELEYEIPQIQIKNKELTDSGFY